MNTSLYYQFAEIEDNHWWFKARRHLIRMMLAKSGARNIGNALDIGCGVGGGVNFLKNFCSEATGIDYSETAVQLAKKKWPMNTFLQCDANKISSYFNPNSFDLITVLNVMYHKWIENDEEFISQVFSILNQGGYVVITEAAFNHLWREHDVLDMGKKRYTLEEMRTLLIQAGFNVVLSSYFNSLSYIPALFSALLYKIKNKKYIKEKEGVSEIDMPGRFLNNLLYFLLKAETWFIRFIGKMPFGVSLICIAKKRED